MLEFNNVSKSFWTGTQRKIILDRVSFRVELGTSLGILAPNGTGKTTLINMMAGLENPMKGKSVARPIFHFHWASWAASFQNIRHAKIVAI